MPRQHGPDDDGITLELWHNRPGGTDVLMTRTFTVDERDLAADTARTLAEGLAKGFGLTITERTLTSWHGER